MSIESFRFEEEDDYARRTFSRQSGAGLHARITSYCKNLFLVVVLVLEWWWWWWWCGGGGGGGPPPPPPPPPSQSKYRYIHVSSYFAQRKKRKQPHRIRNFCTLQIKIIETTVSVSLWRIEFVCGARKLYRFIGQHFLFGSSPLRLSKSPFLFFFGYAILKDVSYMLGAKFTGRKFYR